MSICICILSHQVGRAKSAQRIIFVEDRKVTFTDFSADNAVGKNAILSENCWLQFAGDDVDKARFVIDLARQKIAASPVETWSPQNAVESLRSAWIQCRDNEIEAKLLRKHGFTFDAFRDEGKEKCTEAVYDQLHDRIDRFKLSLEFLVAGFDSDGDPHLFHLDSNGAVSCYDDLGFWAIGSGAHAALSSLSFHLEHSDLCPDCSCVHNLIYFGYEAKFMAETSPQVGKESTFVMVHKHNEKLPQLIFAGSSEKIKKGWLKYGAPKPSPKVMQEIGDLLDENARVVKRPKPRPSVSRKSKGPQ